MISKEELPTLRKACKISMDILRELVNMVGDGVDAIEIDKKGLALIKKYKVKSAFKNYAPHGMPPYPNAVDICINDEVVHGITKPGKIMRTGDLVTVDFGIIYEGFVTDHCITVGVGEVSDENMRLLETARLAVASSINKATKDNFTGDLGHTMSSVAKLAGYDVVKEYIGHGIGKSLHEAPEIPAYGAPGRGQKLRSGMVLCLEAQVVSGSDRIKTDKDRWTVRTADGRNVAWFEYMVLVTDKNPEVLTDTRDWPLVV